MSEAMVYVREPGHSFTREELLHNLDVLLGPGRLGGLRAVPDREFTRFAIFCDKCGDEISDGFGVVLFNFVLPGATPDEPVDYSYNGHGPAFFHKARCDVGEQVFGLAHSWDDLGDVLVYVVNNCGLKFAECEKRVRRLARFGL